MFSQQPYEEGVTLSILWMKNLKIGEFDQLVRYGIGSGKTGIQTWDCLTSNPPGSLWPLFIPCLSIFMCPFLFLILRKEGQPFHVSLWILRPPSSCSRVPLLRCASLRCPSPPTSSPQPVPYSSPSVTWEEWLCGAFLALLTISLSATLNSVQVLFILETLHSWVLWLTCFFLLSLATSGFSLFSQFLNDRLLQECCWVSFSLAFPLRSSL